MGVNLKSNLTPFAKSLRKKTTHAEKQLWHRLRARQLYGYKFRRQQPIGPYIVDFVNFEKKVVVELDGGQHAKQKAQDNERTNWLGAQGYSVLRFWNNDVLNNIEGVLAMIQKRLESPSPGPSRKGRGI